MAVLQDFLNCLSLSSSNNLSSSPFSPQLQQQLQQFVWRNHRKLLISASSTKDSRVNKKGKTPVKTNDQLYKELREFISMAGLPEGHVPSFKDLSHHGRKDLAYIVRRRGYKLVTELLTKSTEEDKDAEISKAEKQKFTSSFDDDSLDPYQEVSELAEDLLPSRDALNIGTLLSSENSVLASLQNGKNCGHDEPGTSSYLLEKASKFIQDGELDVIEDDDINIEHGPFGTAGIDDGVELRSNGQVSNSESSGTTNNSVIKARASTSKMIIPREIDSDNFLQAEEFYHARKDLGIQTGVGYSTREIDNLKAMLHQKELELSKLKEEIEKEKLALSTLQEKAENEIGKAEKMMSSKDDELLNAVERLSGLKEVEIDYWGEGETVEVTGSFNGWHHRIKMDSQPLSVSSTLRPNTTEFRNSRLWSTVLWLYPGKYEIKFVVDGHWKTDPRRETMTKGSIHNNILRV
ncbi:hypothetical protein ACHQM5_010098 [Ranunculus cassubicifolius]